MPARSDIGHGDIDGGWSPERVAAASPAPGLMRALDCGFSRLVEFAAASLVVAETALLGSNTVARYVFNTPFAWADELAQLLFIWLAVLGAAVALRRGEHMRLTAFVRHIKASRRAFIDAVAMMLTAAVLLAMILPGYHHFENLAVGTSPVMEINEGWRGSAVLVGCVLMLVTALQNLARECNWKQALFALAVVGAAGVALTWFGPDLEDLGNANLLLFFVGFVAVAMAIGVPIAFCFMLGTVSFISFIAFATPIPLSIVPDRMDEGMSHIILLAVPLFILLGALIEVAGLARAMITFLVSLIGHLRGGLQYVLLGAMYLVSGISGA
jgi:TRAP-type C4-dicarboxylate transport system permease small subunit